MQAAGEALENGMPEHAVSGEAPAKADRMEARFVMLLQRAVRSVLCFFPTCALAGCFAAHALKTVQNAGDVEPGAESHQLGVRPGGCWPAAVKTAHCDKRNRAGEESSIVEQGQRRACPWLVCG